MSAGNGTFHHQLRHWTGMATILMLPFFLYGFIGALPHKVMGLTEWLMLPYGAITTLVFSLAAIWYCKLEFDEVILDYTDGALCQLGLWANRLTAFISWIAITFVVLKFWLS